MTTPSFLRRLAAACLAAIACGPQPMPAAEFGRFFHVFTAPLARPLSLPLNLSHKAAQRHADADACSPELARLATDIDRVERRMDEWGSIVAKQPDVWGQNRLMRHRRDYEEQMRRQLGMFSERTSAALRRSDQSFLGLALAMQSASGSRRGPQDVAIPDTAGTNNVFTTIQGMLPTTNEQVGRADPVVIARSGPMAFPPNPAGYQFDGEPIGLEPTTHLDQLSRYLNHLNELRRVNEGDDSADAPGCSLNLVRIPVSVLPGGRTRKGHGAEITVTAAACLGPDLLPNTFRSLVINDLVDMIAPALTWCVNDGECVAWAATIAAAPPRAGMPTAARQGVMAAMQSLAARMPALAPAAPPAVKTRRARLPIPFSQLTDVGGIEPIAILIRDTRAALAGHPANRPCIGYLDVRGHLAAELDAATDFLAGEPRRHVWGELPAWNLATLVRDRRVQEIAALRCRFLSGLDAAGSLGMPTEPALVAGEIEAACCGDPPPARAICRTTTAALAWGILVESALLNERLAEDMRETAAAAGRDGGIICRGPFYGPDPPPEARLAFNDYVRCRWPLRVFALDPVHETQNVDDSFSRRRELQIALAAATASGRFDAQAAARATRRLETDLATVALNQTVVGFTHGADTFGWRFHPRVQSPPTRGTLATLAETVCGGPTTDGDLMQRQLEPGQRECTALIVMPSFVPAVTFDVQTRWFSLVHPAVTEPTARETMAVAGTLAALKRRQADCLAAAGDCQPAAACQLVEKIERLERRLPVQTLAARIPFENTAGGFELFNAGITDLAPELVGWYGSPGIDPAATTTLFLVGKGFSVHDTSVVAGGRPARITLASREMLTIEIPPGVQTLVEPCGCGPAGTSMRTGRDGLVLVSNAEPLPPPAAGAAPSIMLRGSPGTARPGSEAGGDRAGIDPTGIDPTNSDPTNSDPTDGDPVAAAGCGTLAGCAVDCGRREMVDIHLATPYGVSGHLLVPVVRRADNADGGGGVAFTSACTLGLTFTATKTAGSKTEAARVDEFFTSDCDAITIAVPASFIPPAKAALQLVLRDAASGATAATLSFDSPFFDARGSRYVIAGGDLRNLVGDTSRPATDKTLRGAVKPYLDSLLARGGLAEDGDTVAFTLTAAIVAEQQTVPVAGGLTVQATRRGKTVVEPAPEAATTAP